MSEYIKRQEAEIDALRRKNEEDSDRLARKFAVRYVDLFEQSFDGAGVSLADLEKVCGMLLGENVNLEKDLMELAPQTKAYIIEELRARIPAAGKGKSNALSNEIIERYLGNN